MTHSLHRDGTAESLKNDYVFLSTPAIGFNHEGSAAKFERILEIVYEVGPTNIGSYDTGTVLTGVTFEQIRDELDDCARVRCVFSDLEEIRGVLQRLKEEDLGVSIVISGLIPEILDLAREMELCPHTINLSLGVQGNTDRLPSETVLQFMTMCGHGMVSKNLVEQMIEDVKAGRRSPRKAAERMALPCVCGIFNQKRAEALLTEIAENSG